MPIIELTLPDENTILAGLQSVTKDPRLSEYHKYLAKTIAGQKCQPHWLTNTLHDTSTLKNHGVWETSVIEQHFVNLPDYIKALLPNTEHHAAALRRLSQLAV